MRVLICGSRDWTDVAAIRAALCHVMAENHVELVIDGAARGADSLGHETAVKWNIPTARFPANWQQYGKAAGPIRNQQMLDEGKPDLVLAFYDPATSRGTKDMVQRARKAGVTVIEHYPR